MMNGDTRAALIKDIGSEYQGVISVCMEIRNITKTENTGGSVLGSGGRA